MLALVGAKVNVFPRDIIGREGYSTGIVDKI